MTPTEQYSNLLSALTAARSVMLSPEWQAALDQGTAEDRVAAGNDALQLQSAILVLSNASLGDIASDMQANASALTAATSGLVSALKSIANVKNILDQATKVLSIVAKIIPLL